MFWTHKLKCMLLYSCQTVECFERDYSLWGAFLKLKLLVYVIVFKVMRQKASKIYVNCVEVFHTNIVLGKNHIISMTTLKMLQWSIIVCDISSVLILYEWRNEYCQTVGCIFRVAMLTQLNGSLSVTKHNKTTWREVLKAGSRITGDAV